MTYKEPLETCLALSLDNKELDEELANCVFRLDGDGYRHIFRGSQFESLGQPKPRVSPSIEKPSALKLKQLPSHLKYAFLGESNTYPMIISTTLTKVQEKNC